MGIVGELECQPCGQLTAQQPWLSQAVVKPQGTNHSAHSTGHTAQGTQHRAHSTGHTAQMHRAQRHIYLHLGSMEVHNLASAPRGSYLRSAPAPSATCTRHQQSKLVQARSLDWCSLEENEGTHAGCRIQVLNHAEEQPQEDTAAARHYRSNALGSKAPGQQCSDNVLYLG